MKKVRLLAILLAVLAAVAIILLLRKNENKEVETSKVVVAADMITTNTMITEDMVKVVKVPKNMVLGNTFADKNAVVGKMASTDIFTGEQIVLGRVSEVGNRETSSLSMLVEEGKRAISVPVNSVTGVHSMIYPGDYVDVVGHYVVPLKESEADAMGTDEKEKFITKTLVENVPVLAVDNVTSEKGKADGYETITLLVTPNEANEIDYVINRGVLRLVLRSPLETKKTGENMIDAVKMKEKKK